MKIIKDPKFKNLNELDQFIYNSRIDKCINCPGIDKCGTVENNIVLGQDMNGIMPVLYEHKFGDHKVISKMQDKYCHLKEKQIKMSKVNLTGSYHDIIMKSNKDILDENQSLILKNIKQNGKGFLFGPAGTGKSTIMQCVAKELYEEGKSLTYELASNITTSLWSFENRESNMNKYQKDDILIIDDFARESLTQYVILNVWSPIIQNRIDNNKPTFITSNHSLLKLYKMIQSAFKDKENGNITADTIVQRMGLLGDYKLEGTNYRL